VSEDGGSLCVVCASRGPTCCQSHEILVTIGDRERIAEHTGLTDFWGYAAPADPSYLDQDDDPNWLRWAFRPDGTRPILKQSAGGCLFLTPCGCSLPMEVRPLVCRLFPYTYTESGLDGVTDECPKDVIPEGRSLLEALGMCEADALRWHSMLYEELRTKERCHADRPDL
jgi:Fe-S-cluster containining protein